MALLRYSDHLSGYSGLFAKKVSEQADYIKCANCNKWTGPGYNNEESSFLQAYYLDDNNKERKFKTYCCLDCFKIDNSSRIAALKR